MSTDVTRREFLATVAAAHGAFVLGFWMPDKTNAWIVVSPDETVTIRIAQTELGQGVWTSNAMMVAEELQCDWAKVRPQYASANRDAREKAPEWTLNVPGNGATDPTGGGDPTFGNRDRTGVAGIPDSLYRRMRTNAASSVKDGRYYLQLAGAEARERLLLAAASLWNVPVTELTSRDSVITHGQSGRTTTYGRVAERAARTPHPHPETIRIKSPDQWTLMGTERKNLDVPLKVTGQTVYGIDVRVPGMKWAAVKACPVYGGDVKRYDFDAVRTMPGVRSAVQFPIPDPSCTRGRIFSGGVAVIADSWYQAKTAIDRMPIEWTIPPENAALNTAMMQDALAAAIAQPGQVRVNQGDVDSGFARAAKIVEATYSTPYLARARMEPGNATVLVTNDRVDIWIGDQSPQETRFSASKITGVPEQNVYIHLCHLGGGYGRNGNGPQAEQAIMIANQMRGTPVHMLWTREEDFIGTTYRAMGMARLKAGLDADGWPIALDVRTSMQQGGFGPDASFDVTSRYYVPSYRYSFHTTKFHPERARPHGGQGSVPVPSRADRPHRPPVQGRRARGARHGRGDVGMGDAAAEAEGARHRARRAGRRSQRHGDDQRHGAHGVREPRGQGAARARGRGARHRLRPGEPALGEEADRRADHLVLQRRDAAGDDHRGGPRRREQLQQVPALADRGRSARDQHPLLPDAALAGWHGPRPGDLDPIGDRRRYLPGHRQAIPGPAVRQARSDLELRVTRAGMTCRIWSRPRWSEIWTDGRALPKAVDVKASLQKR
ncbi:MAG: hypothetical protein DMF88_16150 [Acidobacteria bacterium]|nr:MAG: hypothetical protein DMF88_16150 [Acidobacteriota bacterium]